MTKRVWHKGPPPHRGWWEASQDRSSQVWRWWNGRFWSHFTLSYMSASSAAQLSRHKASRQSEIEWTNYYPANARVPRIAP